MSADRAAALARFLRGAREDAGWSRDRLGRATGLSVNTIRAIESGGVKARGTREPGLFTVVAIIDALGIEISRMMAAIAGSAGGTRE